MNIGFEGILVATLLVIPGFLSSTVQRFLVKDSGPGAQWIAVSVLRSLVLNAVLCAGLVLAAGALGWQILALEEGTKIWRVPAAEIGNLARGLTVAHVAQYLAALYLFAAVYGFLMGNLWKHGKAAAFARGWTPISPFSDVWNDALSAEFRSPENLALHDKLEQRHPWIRLKVDENTEVVGLMKRSSVTIERDKPIEVFLNPVFRVERSTGQVTAAAIPAGGAPVGMYIRIEPETPVEVISAPEAWIPEK